MPSKVANDPAEPSVGRIRADSVASPHSPTSIILCISRAERNPALFHADLFADSTCDALLKRTLHLNPSNWWPRFESGWANGHSWSRRSSGKPTPSGIKLNFGWDVSHSDDNYLSKWHLVWCPTRTSHKMLRLMVTSLWNHRMLYPRGLVRKLLGLLCPFRGDWFQRISTDTVKFQMTAWLVIHCNFIMYRFLTITV